MNPLKIMYLKVYLNLPGAKELILCVLLVNVSRA